MDKLNLGVEEGLNDRHALRGGGWRDGMVLLLGQPYVTTEMALNLLEIGVQTALIAAILAGIGLYVRFKVFPKFKAEAGQWAGAAIGRFWQSLSEKAAEEEGGSSSGSSPAGALELGGFKIDPGMIKSIMELVKLAQSFGFLKGVGGSGSTANPFLK